MQKGAKRALSRERLHHEDVWRVRRDQNKLTQYQDD